MLHFTRNDSQADLYGHAQKIRTLGQKIEQKLSQKGVDMNDSFIETLSVEELKDIRQIMLAAEYLLTKYQDKQDIKAFLEEYIELLLNASNSVNGMKSELEDLVISAEFALKQIQTLHEEVSENLAFGRGVQTKIDDFKMPSLTSMMSPPVHNAYEVKTDLIPVVEQSIELKSREIGSINLTNPASRVNTGDYLERTPVEI